MEAALQPTPLAADAHSQMETIRRWPFGSLETISMLSSLLLGIGTHPEAYPNSRPRQSCSGSPLVLLLRRQVTPPWPSVHIYENKSLQNLAFQVRLSPQSNPNSYSHHLPSWVRRVHSTPWCMEGSYSESMPLLIALLRVLGHPVFANPWKWVAWTGKCSEYSTLIRRSGL